MDIPRWPREAENRLARLGPCPLWLMRAGDPVDVGLRMRHGRSTREFEVYTGCAGLLPAVSPSSKVCAGSESEATFGSIFCGYRQKKQRMSWRRRGKISVVPSFQACGRVETDLQQSSCRDQGLCKHEYDKGRFQNPRLDKKPHHGL